MSNEQYTVVRARYILPFDVSDRSKVIEDGFIVVRNDKIQEVRQYTSEVGRQLVQRYGSALSIYHPSNDANDPIEMMDSAIMPSPKNAHTHFHESLLTGRVKNKNLLGWLDAAVNPHTNWMYRMSEGCRTGQWASEQDENIAQQLGKSPYEIVFAKTLYDQLRYGSGFVVVHNCNFAKYDAGVDAAVKVLEHASARGIVFPGSQNQFYTPNFLLDKDHKNAVARVRAQIERHADKRWARVMPGFDQIFSNSPSLLRTLKDLAREIERETGQPVYFHGHSSENEGATRYLVVANTGFTPVQNASLAGILDERTILAHQVHTTEADLVLLQKAGAQIVSNPTANGSLFSGIAPVAAMLNKGIRVAYSTDGSGSSDHQDMFTVMHVGVNMNRGSEKEGALILTDQKALEMILVDPALMYGLNADSLEPGKDATFVAYDLDSERNPAIHPHSLDTIIGKLVFCQPTGLHVTDSMSLGIWIVQDRKVQTMNREEVMRDITLLDRLYWNQVYPTLKIHEGTGKK